MKNNQPKSSARHGGNRVGAGRPSGSRNKRTVEREAEMARAAKQIEEALEHPFDGDAHSLLVAVYKDEARPIELRLEAARAAVRYERPALAAVDMRATNENVVYRLSDEPISLDEWQSRYCNEPKH